MNQIDELRAATVRVATLFDAAAIQAIYASYVRETAISFETEPPSIVEMRDRIAKTTPKYPWLVYERGSDILGYAYATQHRVRDAYRWSVDVAVYVRRDKVGQGIGRELYRVLFQLLAKLGYANAFAGIALPNAASVALHEAMGFTSIGRYKKVGYKLGNWHDVGWWQKSFEYSTVPSEPILMSKLDVD